MPETGPPLSPDETRPQRRTDKTCITFSADNHGALEKLSEVQTESEKIIIFQALKTCNGNMTKASKRLGISRQLLNYRIKKFNFNREDFIETDSDPKTL